MPVPIRSCSLVMAALLAPGPALPQDWQGAYAGVHLGAAVTDFSAGAPGDGGDASGALGGVQLGYNWQRGSSVLGAEADLTFTDISRRLAAGRRAEDLVTSLRLRAGVSRGRTLYYGALGVAWTGRELARPGGATESGFEPGVMVGAGAERFLGGNVAGRVEAYYLDTPGDTRARGGSAVSTGSESVQFRAGLNLHF